MAGVPEWAKKETLYTLTELASKKERLLPIRVSKRMLSEYVTLGKLNPYSRERVLLDSVRFGIVYYTSVERFMVFWDEVNY